MYIGLNIDIVSVMFLRSIDVITVLAQTSNSHIILETDGRVCGGGGGGMYKSKECKGVGYR